jgi:SAM-dependent methyltransferase
MANDFPHAMVTGIDISPIFPSEIKPPNCRFLRHNIIERFPFPDNTFDFVFQRLLVAGLTRDHWTFVLKELERITKPGGWIELVEANVTPGNAGPHTHKLCDWLNSVMSMKGIDLNIGEIPGLPAMMKEANIVNIQHEVIHLPSHKEGGKAAVLLKEDAIMSWGFISQMAMRDLGVSQEECDEAIRLANDEIEEYKTYGVFYFARGQKQEMPENEEELHQIDPSNRIDPLDSLDQL